MLQLKEIIYKRVEDGAPGRFTELGRETVNPDQWHQTDGRTYLAFKPGNKPGSGACDITDMLTGEHPKFVLVEVADPN